MLPDGLTLAQVHFSEEDPRVRGFSWDLPPNLAPTLALFTLSLEEEHVGVDGPLVHVFLDSLRQKRALKEPRLNPNSAPTQTHHFRVSSVDDDPRALWRGGHLAGGARGGAKACGGEAAPGESVQGERVDVIVVDKVPEGGRVEVSAAVWEQPGGLTLLETKISWRPRSEGRTSDLEMTCTSWRNSPGVFMKTSKHQQLLLAGYHPMPTAT